MIGQYTVKIFERLIITSKQKKNITRSQFCSTYNVITIEIKKIELELKQGHSIQIRHLQMMMMLMFPNNILTVDFLFMSLTYKQSTNISYKSSEIILNNVEILNTTTERGVDVCEEEKKSSHKSFFLIRDLKLIYFVILLQVTTTFFFFHSPLYYERCFDL